MQHRHSSQSTASDAPPGRGPNSSQDLSQRQRPGPIRRALARLKLRGTYVDYWTFLHVALGLAVGLVLVQLEFSAVTGILIAAAIFIAWEIIEPPLHRLAGRDFPEKPTNQIVDVVAGMCGAIAAYVAARPSAIVILVLEMLEAVGG